MAALAEDGNNGLSRLTAASEVGPKPDVVSGLCCVQGIGARCQERKWPAHSITSSARASNVGGTLRPSVLAVLRLITKSNLVD